MKINLSARFLMLALLCGSCVLNTPKEELEYNGMNTLQISNVDDLISFYQYADDRIPLISGHRGGRGKGYPENSMETFENTLSYTPATFEIDPRLTKDSVIVLFHDDTLERTSNGTGKVSDYTWEELQNFRLKDPEGNITNYRIPTLEEAIRWARGKTILILDKKDVPMERTAQLITDMQAEPYVMITVHDGASARFFFMKNVVGLAQSSIWIYSIPLKHIVTAAHYNGKIPRNPFALYHVDPDHKEREFLTLDELTAMTDIKLEDPNMAFARDLFIFGCWTGISFIDIKNLTEDNISMVNSAPWIVSKRQKTGVPFQIKLMDIPMQIVERYKSFRKGNHLFNIGNLDGINKRIKKVAVMCGIKKRVSFHVSRHSWAVLALEYGMPIESVSKILGHTNITTTQIYAKVTSTKLDHDIAVFESRIKGHLPVMGGMA